jgi:hypothetical protein
MALIMQALAASLAWLALALAYALLCIALMFYAGLLGGVALALGGGFALWMFHTRRWA